MRDYGVFLEQVDYDQKIFFVVVKWHKFKYVVFSISYVLTESGK